MLKTLFLASAMLIAAPALAQTAKAPSGGTPTTTNDHDPTMEGGTTSAGTANGSVSTQVNGGTTSASTAGTGAGGTAMDHSQHNMGAMGTGGMGNTGKRSSRKSSAKGSAAAKPPCCPCPK